MNIEITCSRLSTMPPQRIGEYRVNIINATINAPDEAAQREMLSLVDEAVLRQWMAENGLTLVEAKAVA
ncbi:hypothetical protein [Serratia sp. MF2]|uniref:hypothetical protein n=1 Tax=Serratia sp. MF2 TaxID=3059173 RepID=UPI0027E8C3A6|nr:hypothetical protein [Serratia sp. MF2]MDQ7101471.1 hypothetical protein [Serratia sp. MF2]